MYSLFQGRVFLSRNNKNKKKILLFWDGVFPRRWRVLSLVGEENPVYPEGRESGRETFQPHFHIVCPAVWVSFQGSGSPLESVAEEVGKMFPGKIIFH